MYRYQLEHFIRTGERPEDVRLPSDGLLWTNASGFNRRSVLSYLYGETLPATFTALFPWMGAAGYGQFTGGPDAYWLTDEATALQWIKESLFPKLRAHGDSEWDARAYTIAPRPPEPAHRKGFPSIVETATHIIGLPPEARRRSLWEGTGFYDGRDLIDPVTGLVPVFLIRTRRREEA